MAILIKRYANRKLYNTETSRYITLKGIAKLLDEGEEVRVIDKETGEDITQVALSQILVDNKRAREDPSDGLLTQILSRGGDALYGAIKKSVDEATDGLGDFQDRFRTFVKQADPISRAGAGFAWDSRTDRRSPFSANPSSSSKTADSTSGSGSHRSEHLSEHGSEYHSENSSKGRPKGTTQNHSQNETDSGSRSSWPRRGVFPDIREAIRSVVAHELDALDLPRNRDIETLNENLTRVAIAVERLESALRDRESTDD